ncbi:hypothetical protein ABTX86_30855, partial [Streptomyces anulatus]
DFAALGAAFEDAAADGDVRAGQVGAAACRLVLRGEHGLAVDRGRIVREAVAVVLADLESRGDASILVRRLRGR